MVLRQDEEFGLVVVDLAKDPLAAGPLARSTPRNLNLDKALVLCDGDGLRLIFPATNTPARGLDHMPAIPVNAMNPQIESSQSAGPYDLH